MTRPVRLRALLVGLAASTLLPAAAAAQLVPPAAAPGEPSDPPART